MEWTMTYFVFAVSKDTMSSLQDVQGGAEVNGKTRPFYHTNNHQLWQL